MHTVPIKVEIFSYLGYYQQEDVSFKISRILVGVCSSSGICYQGNRCITGRLDCILSPKNSVFLLLTPTLC